MVFIAFTLLRAIPVGKQTEMPVDQRDGHHHIAGDAEGGDATEESEEQADAAKEFGADGQECKRGRDVRLLSEEAHGTGEAVAPEPAEGLLIFFDEAATTEKQ